MTSARLAEIKKMFVDERVHPRCTLDHDVVIELLNAVASIHQTEKAAVPGPLVTATITHVPGAEESAPSGNF